MNKKTGLNQAILRQTCVYKQVYLSLQYTNQGINLMDIEEQALILKVSQGDEDAFSKLFHQYHKHLAVFVYKITGSPDLVEEVVQDAFLKIWINRTQLIHVKNFKSYLFTVSKNHSINCLKQQVRNRILQQQWQKEHIHHTEDIEESPTNYFALLDQAIDALPPQQQKVYVLSKHQRLKYAEIANLMGISKETVKSYLKLAIGTIMHHIKKHLYLLFMLLIK